MILLQGHSLARKDWFLPESMSLSLEERTSTASMTLGPEAPEISVGDWMLDDTEPGKGIVWRAKTVSTDVGTRTRTVQLEHVIQALRDLVLFGEIKPENISGGETCTTREAAAYILRGQSEWRLGDVAVSRSAPYNFNGDSLYSALETVTGSVEDLQWEYDLSSMPFTLHLRKYPAGFQSEMRMRRNISKMRIQIDRTRMYTRLYPIGENNLHISGDYVSRNENIWGTISKVLTDQTKGTEEELRTWATQNLKRHCEPLVTVTITGLDLSRATGEPLDRIVVGRRCRVPIPKYGITMTERVTKMTWADKIRKPEEIGVTLANLMEDVASIINQRNESTASSSASGRRGAKKNEEDHAWFVDTTDHVAMVAEAVAGPGASKDWSRVAEVLVDGQGIHQRVTETEGNIVKYEARLEINEKAITQEVKDRSNADTTLSGRITTEAGRITAEVERATGAEGRLNGRITVEAGKISQIVEAVGSDGEVTAASIVLAINNAGESEAHIDANKVYIGNDKSTTVIRGKLNASDVTAEYLDAKISQITVMHVNSIQAASGASNANLSLPSVSAWNRLYIGSGADTLDLISNGVKDAVTNLQLTLSGNTYTLQKQTIANHADWTNVGTFSRATALSGAWSGGKFEVTASPQGEVKRTTIDAVLTNGTVTFDTSTGLLTVPLKVMAKVDSGSQTETGYSTSIKVIGGPAYNAGYVAGWNAARAKVSRSGNSVYRPKARSGTDITTDVGTEAYATAGLNSYSAWGKAKSQYRLVTPGGTGSWTGTQNYEAVGSYKVSNTLTVEYRSTEGYYGWNTAPEIEWQ